ncbi:MAG: hypothetical protein KC636_36655 [Myxococcales bacterium]|nr:hypothetical protein [Myxococcales bacterium]
MTKETSYRPLSLACFAFAGLLACGDSTGDEGTATGSGGETATDASTTAGPGSDGSDSGSEATTTGGTDSGSTGTDTDPTASSDSDSEATTVDPTDATTVDPTDATTVDPTDETTVDPTDATTDETTDATTDGVTDATTEDTDETTGPDCQPSEEVCNDVDDDCDGLIDNVDVGMDGICDCLNIALVGNEGANPSAEFQAWLEAQGTQVDRIHTNANEPLDPATLSKYDIVILDWLVRSYSAEEAKNLRDWVEAGGGVMSMTGHTNNNTVVDRPNSLIGPMGLTYNASKGFFSGPITNFAPHPITMGLTSISFYGGLYVDIVEDGIGVNTTIMTLPQGPVGVVQDRISGTLFIFGDEWVEFDSEWMNIPQIKQFWVQVLAYIGPKESCLVPQ